MVTRTCLVNKATQHPCGDRRHLARLTDDRVTARKRRCHLEREQVQRQVPWADQGRHPDRTALGVVDGAA